MAQAVTGPPVAEGDVHVTGRRVLADGVQSKMMHERASAAIPQMSDFYNEDEKAGAPKDPGTRSLVVGYPTGAA
jgi:hypothetical protein